MVPLSWCRVCSRNTAKDRVHYGGISCYSCRSFFRRNTNLGVHQLPSCKGSGSCTITDTARDQCRLCRYQKCMRQENNPYNNGRCVQRLVCPSVRWATLWVRPPIMCPSVRLMTLWVRPHLFCVSVVMGQLSSRPKAGEKASYNNYNYSSSISSLTQKSQRNTTHHHKVV